MYNFVLFYFFRFCLFILEKNGGRKRTETSMWERNMDPLPHQGPNPQPSHVPWPGIKPVIFCFVGCCPSHWAKPVRAHCANFKAWTKWFYMQILVSKIDSIKEEILWKILPMEGNEKGIKLYWAQRVLLEISFTHLFRK